MSVAPVCTWPAMSPSPPVTPKATGSCFHTIVMPMAASMPLMTADGTRAANRPMRSSPNATCRPPAIITAARNGVSPPRWSTSTSTIEVSPAAGPVTESAERLMKGTTSPPAMPATSPDTGGTPHATAIPRQSGSATRKTTRPATASSLGWPNIEGW